MEQEKNTLTSKAIETMLTKRHEEIGKSHLLQIYAIKASNESNARLRRTMLLSDGGCFIRGVTTELETAQELDVVDVTEYRVTDFRETIILIIDKARIAFTGIKEIISTPIEFSYEVSNEPTTDPIIPPTAIKIPNLDKKRVRKLHKHIEKEGKTKTWFI